MASTNHIVRNRLDMLWNQLANPDKALVADDGNRINNPSALNILHIPQFDFEHLDVETDPRILFEPMPLSELHKYPVDPNEMDEGRSFMDYQDRPDDLHRNAKACAMRICDCVEDWATGSARGIPDLLEIRELQEVRLVGLVPSMNHSLMLTACCLRIPNLFLLNQILFGCYPDTSLKYSHCTILETERDNSQNAHPLIVMPGYQPCNGQREPHPIRRTGTVGLRHAEPRKTAHSKK